VRLSGIEPAVGRVVAMVPAALLVLLTCILLLLALPCDKDRRAYALAASALAMGALAALLRTSPDRKGQASASQTPATVHSVVHDPLAERITTHETFKRLPQPTQLAIDLLEAFSRQPPIRPSDGES
jgi:hypothetical protein